MSLYLCILLNKSTVIALSNLDADDDDRAFDQAYDQFNERSECTAFDIWREGKKLFHYTRPVDGARR